MSTTSTQKRQVRLTKKTIEQIEPESKQVEYQDTKKPELRLRVYPTGRKVYVVLKRHKGKLHRVTLGNFPDLTPDAATREADNVLALIVSGVSPNDKRRASASQKVTLHEALETYLSKNRQIKDSTKANYRRMISTVLKKYLNEPLHKLDRDAVTAIHTSYSEQAPSVANSAMRVLRAVFNFANGEYRDENKQSLFPDNPTKELSRLKAWNKLQRRKTLIRKHQMPMWFSAVLDLPELYPTEQAPVVRDYFLTLLFTGLRRQEAARLTVEDVNTSARLIFIPDTKNSETHELPIGEYLAAVLARRKREAVNGWLFPNRTGKGHIDTFTKAQNAVIEASGVDFMPHDLRRTFTTIAEAQNLSRYTLKRLLNHKEGDDVTGGYIVLDTERLREPVEAIERQILKLAGIEPVADVVSLDAVRRKDGN